jgi:hypothetical protein
LTAYWFDPLRDTRWTEFIQRHPASSIFHTVPWLLALHRTYGLRPVVLTTCAPDYPLTNGIVLCRIHSWLTGRRLVSLPFSDHCEPLVDRMEYLQDLLQELSSHCDQKRYAYFELRPLRPGLFSSGDLPKPHQAESFVHHTLDLHPHLDELMAGFHKDCIQRKIHRADRDGLQIEAGRSDSLLNKFYQLQIMTRRRHKLPPQPRSWFRNLSNSLGEDLTILVASINHQPAAGILTLRHKHIAVYKYGCSDPLLNSHGGMQYLFWEMIKRAKALGLTELDMGRSDRDNPGLISFKDRWGASRSTLTYLRYPESASDAVRGWKMIFAGRIFSHMPQSLLTFAGKLLYKHVD